MLFIESEGLGGRGGGEGAVGVGFVAVDPHVGYAPAEPLAGEGGPAAERDGVGVGDGALSICGGHYVGMESYTSDAPITFFGKHYVGMAAGGYAAAAFDAHGFGGAAAIVLLHPVGREMREQPGQRELHHGGSGGVGDGAGSLGGGLVGGMVGGEEADAFAA